MRSMIKVLCFSSLVCLVVSTCPWAGWIENGIPLTPQFAANSGAVIVSDGSSGAILAYEVCIEGISHIVAQRIDGEGNRLWGEDGVVLCPSVGGQYDPQIATDGAGGAIVTWRDYHSGDYDIYAQRVGDSGTVLWQAEGVPLCTATESQYGPQITTDGSGGAIVTWEDYRSGDYDIYAQRVDASGVAQWQTDGVPLCTAAGIQEYPQITIDGSGGAIVTWYDYRSGSYSDIYAQRVDGSGTVLWQADGVPLCTATGSQIYPQITTDGSGGAIVTWYDYRSGSSSDIYAQRVDGSGTVLWQADGVSLCTAAGTQHSPQITTDGSGGAIVTWFDDRSGNYDIYAQRVDGSGVVQWQTDGVPLCTAPDDQESRQITTDGLGGAIVTWEDYRSGTSSDIYAQRVDGSGTVLWQADGVLLCTAAGYQRYPQITTDGSGGLIVTWRDSRSGSWDIYAQRVDGSGTVLWQADGVPLCTAGRYQQYPQITTDGSGGAIVTWFDNRSGNSDIYAQRVDGSGTILWQADGVPLCTATGYQRYPQPTTDGSGGAIVTWYDYRSGNWDIYAQRVDGSGVVQWQTDGVPLCTAAGYQYNPQITTDGSGGAIVTWRDFRSGSYSDIYAQRVDGSGVVQWLTDGVSLCTAPDDQGYPQITTDGLGGAIVTWHDSRSGNNDIYAQRVDGLGLIIWQADGVPLCTAAGIQEYPQITIDGSGGAIVTWYDGRSDYYDIYAQRVDGLGVVQWQVWGVPICTAAGYQYFPQITTDGSGGAIVTWYDYRSGSYSDIYAQRVDGSGTVLWQADGVPLCAALGNQYSPQITTDGLGGAIVTWYDGRSDYYDIYAQRVDGSGVVQWLTDGVSLCTAPDDQGYPQITTDGLGGAIITWRDERCGASHIYAARVSGSGDLVSTLLQSYAAACEGGSVRISWTLSEIDQDARFAILSASAPDWTYTEIEDPSIEREGLSYSFTDTDIFPGSVAKYRVDVVVEGMASRTLFETEEITIPALPLTLYQNHPNPFNPNTTIRFYLPEAGEIALDIYNVAGQRVVRLAEGRREWGHQEVSWDGRNSWGADCSSGIYFYRLRAGKSSISRKMVLLR